MKRLLFVLMLVLTLSGCQSLYPDEYLSVSEHVAPFAYRETEPPPTETEGPEQMPTVSLASDIREAIKRMVIHGEETGEFLLVHYVGDVNQDMGNMYFTLRSDSPKYAYAMTRPFGWQVINKPEGSVVSISIDYRLKPEQVQAIQTRLYKAGMLEREVCYALSQQDSTYTVQVSGYQETDFYAVLDNYILDHPEQIVEAPDIQINIFPSRGSVRLLDIHYDYNTDHDTLSQRKNDTVFMLSLVYNQMVRESPEEMVETLAMHLIPPIGYVDDPGATVYTQTVLKTSGSSRTMASVVKYLCTRATAECEIVVGEREGEPWYWNRIMVDGRWRSFDLHAAALAGDYHPALLPSEEMVGYSWDPESYPEVEEPEEVEPSESLDPEESTEATEPTAPSETTASSEPTEPVQTSEAPQTTDATEPATEVP